MNNLLVFWNLLFVLCLIWGHLSTCSGFSYRYVVMDDLPIGAFGKVDAPADFEQSMFFMANFQQYVNIKEDTGVLWLNRRLSALPKDRNGIRWLRFDIVVRTNFLAYFGFPPLDQHTVIKIEMVILPLNFGDAMLRKYGQRLRSGLVKESGIEFGSSPQALHRMQRMMSEKNQPESFHIALSAVKARKVMHIAIGDMLRSYLPGVKFKNEYHILALNSLFSQHALSVLSVQAGCRDRRNTRCQSNKKYRSADGSCNNLRSPWHGSSSSVFTRLMPARYYDPEGLDDPAGPYDQPFVPHLPSPFVVARDFVIKRRKPQTNEIFSHILMQWGQWLDHDIDLSPESQSSDNCRNAPCDGSRADFEPPCHTILPIPNNRCIHFTRSMSKCQIENGRVKGREQVNINTAFIDGSQLYGSTLARMDRLRDRTNELGLLRVERGVDGDLLTRDRSGLTLPNNLCLGLGDCFATGDNRGSETTILASLHNVFLREHNKLARTLKNINPHWNGEKIFQESRKICGAVFQKITYNDYLPIIIGNTLPPYRGYNPNVNPGVINAFAAAVFRFGHSQIRPAFDQLNANFEPIGDPIPLRHLFFNNTYIRRHGIDPLVLGLLGNASERVDNTVAADLLEKLFDRPHHPALNLVALNIQRGRDHGLPGYNTYRKYCGLRDAKRFDDTLHEIRDSRNRRVLANMYNNNPDLADLWAAGLAEEPANGGIVGPTFGCVIGEQMKRLRDGDRYFYKNRGVFTRRQVAEIEKGSLSGVLCDALGSIVSIQRNAFLAGNNGYRRVECSQIPKVDLRAWKEF